LFARTAEEGVVVFATEPGGVYVITRA